jgi:hypothetical protein
VVDDEMMEVVDGVRTIDDDAESARTLGGLKMWDFAPDIRGAEPRSRCWTTLNAPGIGNELLESIIADRSASETRRSVLVP